jgi:hypothetical protein
MFIYAHWLRDGYQQIQAFNKPERAAQYAYDQIAQYASNEEKQFTRDGREKEIPAELKAVREKLAEVANKPTIANAILVIELYEDYCRYVSGNESPLHTITDTSVVE